MSKFARVKIDIDIRRTRVAEMLLERRPMREIASILGVSVGSVVNDAKAVRAEWRARRLELLDERGAEDLARSEAAIAAIWPFVVAGKGWAIDRLIALLTYRARVLGLESRHTEVDIGSALANYLARATGSSNAAPS